MKKIGTLIKEHKAVALVCLFLLIVFVGGVRHERHQRRSDARK